MLLEVALVAARHLQRQPWSSQNCPSQLACYRMYSEDARALVSKHLAVDTLKLVSLLA